jgi:hypothetical protein
VRREVQLTSVSEGKRVGGSACGRGGKRVGEGRVGEGRVGVWAFAQNRCRVSDRASSTNANSALARRTPILRYVSPDPPHADPPTRFSHGGLTSWGRVTSEAPVRTEPHPTRTPIRRSPTRRHVSPMGVDIMGQGHLRSPGSDGASHYQNADPPLADPPIRFPYADPPYADPSTRFPLPPTRAVLSRPTSVGWMVRRRPVS